MCNAHSWSYIASVLFYNSKTFVQVDYAVESATVFIALNGTLSIDWAQLILPLDSLDYLTGY